MSTVQKRIRNFGGMLPLAAVALMSTWFAPASYAQLNENCVVSVLNRTVQVKSDGSWVLPNVPAGFGRVKARATCVNNGVTTFGESPFFVIPANGSIDVPSVTLGNATPIPVGLAISSNRSTITQQNGTAQLTVIANFGNGTTRNVTAGATGTTYNASNPAIATVSQDGLVTAKASGTVLLQAINEGTPAFLTIDIALTSDSDNDGIPDDAEINLGLDPRNAADASLDFDTDGLTNVEEFRAGTGLRNADTDGDGLNDGQEVKTTRTNPLVADTDGDGIPDGVEVRSNSNPLDRSSVNYAAAVQSIAITPPSFTLIVNTIVGTAYTQLNVRATLIDGTTQVNLTSTALGTRYASSDLTTCNFGSPDGRVFAGNPGNCTITVTAAGRPIQIQGSVRNFTPLPVSNLAFPGFPNKVKVQGNYAYIAAGASGLQIANITDKTAPSIAGSLALPGNANDVEIVGNIAYIAGGNSGLHIIDVSNPAAPILRGTAATSGPAQGVVVRNNTAFVAAGSQLTIVNVSNPGAPLVAANTSIAGNGKAITLDTNRSLAIVTLGAGGIQIFNVANPASPQAVSTRNLPGGDSRGAKVSGNYLFLADYGLSLTSIDITNPANPVVL
ncbi:MAG: Ig-like domain-containing protein, partial [Bryobacteraceae bacterium]|nr:Ig-like domain-containing protein [Bryobacteraceae bacterium]